MLRADSSTQTHRCCLEPNRILSQIFHRPVASPGILALLSLSHVGEQVTGPHQEAGTFTSRLAGDLAARAHPLCWPGWPASPHPPARRRKGDK